MRIEIRITSGALTGTVHTYESVPVSVGRAPESGLQFHVIRDRTVSTRHALLYPEGGRWWVSDLESRNGTYLNGRRIDRPEPLSDGDRIVFGRGGAEVEVGLAPPLSELRSGATKGSGPLDGSPAPAPRLPGASPTHALRLGVAGLGVAGLVALLLVVILQLVASTARERAAWEAERAGLLSRLDSVLAAGDVAARGLEGEREELAQALRNSQEELRVARRELEAMDAGDDVPGAEALRAQIQILTIALERQQLAASLDFDAIERGNRPAVALLFVETESGEVVTGTAFAVRSDARLLTTRHLVRGEDGLSVPRRIGVQFSDSPQVFSARLLGVDPDHDIALLAAEGIVGEVPTVRGFRTNVEEVGSGAPVAVIGFPLGGGEADPSGTRALARPLVSSGVIASSSAGSLEVYGYGAAGASGSPIFDRTGRVLGLVFGGIRGPDGQRIFGVPAGQLVELIEQYP